MERAPKHYGWLVSPYSAKTRSYLRFRGDAFEDVVPGVWTLRTRIGKAVGRVIMPTVELPDGTWLQDSSVIIDHFEGLSGATRITPSSPTQRVASALLEVFADEWLPMAALHYRWNLPENAAFALAEFARSGLPLAPGWVGRRAVGGLARRMQSYLGVLGVTESTQGAIEETVQLTLSALDTQLSQSPYVLGARPCMGDFALYGPLWAHLYRDPASRTLFDDRPHVTRWMARLTEGARVEGDFFAGDEVPSTLDPLFECVFVDQWAWLKTLVDAIDAYCAAHPDATRVPRSLGSAPFTVRGVSAQRKLATFVQWKAQRAERAYRAAGGEADRWMGRVLARPDVSDIIPTIAHPFALSKFKAVLATAP
ncbi:MAG: glutathione S-transferase family protein [Myxococcota bacterium]